ncbi:hypothetical protein [Microbulbifer sp. DLAB2-AA]|uniref:hypothetical protein n=1 Tax=Microbulbifer sp. DLAB2-AA TaxID=3243394 RepID=UPI0040392706
MKKILTPDEIIDQIKNRLGLTTDVELANLIGVQKQNINQFRQGKGGNLPCRLFTAVLDESQAASILNKKS